MGQELPLASFRHAADANVDLSAVAASPLPIPVVCDGSPRVLGKVTGLRLDADARMLMGSIELECPDAAGVPILSCMVAMNQLQAVRVMGPRPLLSFFQDAVDEPLVVEAGLA
jgi:hypothetical protein